MAAAHMPTLTSAVARPAPSRSSARQPEGAVDQRVGEHGVGRDGDERDPQRRLGPVDRAHEVAQRDERPAGDDGPGHAGEIAAGQRGRLRRLAQRDQDVLAPELQQRQRHAQRSPPPTGRRAARGAPCAAGARRRPAPPAAPRPTPGPCRGEGGKQHRVRQRRRRQRRVAEAADQRPGRSSSWRSGRAGSAPSAAPAARSRPSSARQRPAAAGTCAPAARMVSS